MLINVKTIINFISKVIDVVTYCVIFLVQFANLRKKFRIY